MKAYQISEKLTCKISDLYENFKMTGAKENGKHLKFCMGVEKMWAELTPFISYYFGVIMEEGKADIPITTALDRLSWVFHACLSARELFPSDFIKEIEQLHNEFQYIWWGVYFHGVKISPSAFERFFHSLVNLQIQLGACLEEESYETENLMEHFGG